ncbi:hypothetical protein KAR91_25635 [Candidatus Pacearchaeota archaeon]|nr:hypothetical protein [Candidatus Pacearchaeota archaeon]
MTDKKKLGQYLSMMEKELSVNSGKGKWDKLHPLYLCAELHYHASKLYKACDENDIKSIAEYAADCGNLSMMIADVTNSLKQEQQ